MKKISAEMMPLILTHDQKQCQFHISSDLLCNVEMFDRVITSDEMWRFQYDPEINDDGKHKIYLGQKKARVSRLQVKIMLVCFFDHKGIVHCECIVQGQAANQHCYIWKC
jgi:hypothetical protein